MRDDGSPSGGYRASHEGLGRQSTFAHEISEHAEKSVNPSQPATLTDACSRMRPSHPPWIRPEGDTLLMRGMPVRGLLGTRYRCTSVFIDLIYFLSSTWSCCTASAVRAINCGMQQQQQSASFTVYYTPLRCVISCTSQLATPSVHSPLCISLQCML